MPHVLMIDNGSEFIPELLALTRLHATVDTVHVQSFTKEQANGYDAVVLSGGRVWEVEESPEVFTEQVALIRETDIPLFGVCLGLQIVCKAYGSTIRPMGYMRMEDRSIYKTDDDPIFTGLERPHVSVGEAHSWRVDHVDGLNILAMSDDGIEVVSDSQRMIYATQFHPEMLVDRVEGSQVFANFFGLLADQ